MSPSKAQGAKNPQGEQDISHQPSFNYFPYRLPTTPMAASINSCISNVYAELFKINHSKPIIEYNFAMNGDICACFNYSCGVWVCYTLCANLRSRRKTRFAN